MSKLSSISFVLFCLFLSPILAFGQKPQPASAASPTTETNQFNALSGYALRGNFPKKSKSFEAFLFNDKKIFDSYFTREGKKVSPLDFENFHIVAIINIENNMPADFAITNIKQIATIDNPVNVEASLTMGTKKLTSPKRAFILVPVPKAQKLPTKWEKAYVTVKNGSKSTPVLLRIAKGLTEIKLVKS